MGPPEKEVSDRNQYVFGDTNSSPVLRIRVSKAAVPRNLADIQFGCLYKVQYWWIRHSSLVQKWWYCMVIPLSLLCCHFFPLVIFIEKKTGAQKTPLFGIFGPKTRKGTCEFHPRELCALGWALAVTKAWELPGSGFFGRVWCFMITPTDTTRQNIQKQPP